VLESKIKDALIRFNSGIKNSDGPAISTALNEVEALLAAHRGELPPQLVHFLEGRSYAKALAYLGGESEFARPASPPGGCGNH
jgi:hypothetical protein